MFNWMTFKIMFSIEYNSPAPDNWPPKYKSKIDQG